MSFRQKNALSGYPAYHSLAQIYGIPLVHKRFIANKFSQSCGLFQKDLRGHFGCVNAIDFSNKGGEFIVSGGDDRRILVWNLDKCLFREGTPAVMSGEHRSNIFCTVFDSENRHIFSGGNDDQVIQHDVTTGETVDVFPHVDPVYGVSIHPECDNLFLTAGDSGKVLLWDTRVRQSEPPLGVAQHPSAFHGAVFNPVDAHLVATANSKRGVELWDARATNKCLRQFSSSIPTVCTAMGVRWNATGTYLTALRRHLPPVLFRIDRPSPLVEFCHPGYKNVFTMKNSCFGGDKDQYIISGSDDFNVYIWEVPELPEPDAELVTVNRAFLVLTGHRSIVNQVRFNPDNHLIISTGVEKILKVWSPFSIPSGSGAEGLNTGANPRDLFSHEDYLNLVMLSGRPLTHEYDAGTTEEDPRMLAFFDSLIQGKSSGWDSDSDFSLDDFYLSFPLADSSGSDVDAEGVSLRRLREILAQQQSGRSETDNSQALYRRLRRFSRESVLRQLIGSDSESDSTSNDSISSEEEEPQEQVVLPDLNPPETQSEEPVGFRTRQSHRRRRYRVQGMSSDSSSSTNSEEVSLADSHINGHVHGACSSVNCEKSLPEKDLTKGDSSDEQTENVDNRSASDVNEENKTVAITNGTEEKSGEND